MAGIGKAIGAASKALKKTSKASKARTQTRKQISKEGFDNSKVKTGNVKVTKIKKPTTPKKPKSTPKKTAVKKTAVKKTTAKKAPVKKSPKSTLSSPVKKVTKAPAKKTAKKTARKTPAKKVAKKKTAVKKTTTSTPPNARGTSERAGIGGGRSTKDTLKGSGGKQETRLATIPKKTKKTKKKGPSANAKKNARRKKLLKFIRNERSLTGKAIRGGKAVAKKSGTAVIAGGAGYLGGRMGSSGNVADTAKQKTTGFTQAELDAARMRYYGGR